MVRLNPQKYAAFILDNKSLVDLYNKQCEKTIIPNLKSMPSVDRWLFHGTSEENAQRILKNGFEIDPFEGAKPMGLGVYFAPDKNGADCWGEVILNTKVSLKQPLHWGPEAIFRLNELRDKFFGEIVEILRKFGKKYVCDDEKVAAEMKRLDFERLHTEEVLERSASLIQNNILDICLKPTGKRAFHTHDFDKIHQFVVRDLEEIKGIDNYI